MVAVATSELASCVTTMNTRLASSIPESRFPPRAPTRRGRRERLAKTTSNRKTRPWRLSPTSRPTADPIPTTSRNGRSWWRAALSSRLVWRDRARVQPWFKQFLTASAAGWEVKCSSQTGCDYSGLFVASPRGLLPLVCHAMLWFYFGFWCGYCWRGDPRLSRKLWLKVNWAAFVIIQQLKRAANNFPSLKLKARQLVFFAFLALNFDIEIRHVRREAATLRMSLRKYCH